MKYKEKHCVGRGVPALDKAACLSGQLGIRTASPRRHAGLQGTRLAGRTVAEEVEMTLFSPAKGRGWRIRRRRRTRSGHCPPSVRWSPASPPASRPCVGLEGFVSAGDGSGWLLLRLTRVAGTVSSRWRALGFRRIGRFVMRRQQAGVGQHETDASGWPSRSSVKKPSLRCVRTRGVVGSATARAT